MLSFDRKARFSFGRAITVSYPALKRKNEILEVVSFLMSFNVVSAVEPDHIRFTVLEAYSFDRMFDFIEFVRTEADRAKRSQVLIDCSKLEGSMTEADRFQGGQRIAQVFGNRIKVALVMPEGEVTKLGELTAVNRGARFLVTDSFTEAEQWLLGSGQD